MHKIKHIETGVLGTEWPRTSLQYAIKEIKPETVFLEDVLVPTGLPLEDEDEAWVELFEWIGMCTIGTSGSPR
jgi:hypothetical protein